MRIPGLAIVLLGLAGCSAVPSPSVTSLAGSSWRVMGLNGGGVDSFRVTIAFDENGQATGFASCNDYRFAYDLGGGHLRFARTVTMTSDRVCDLEAIRIEENFLATLGEVDRAAVVQSGSLVLYADEGRRIIARPA